MTHDFTWINKNNIISLLDSDSDIYVSRKHCLFQTNDKCSQFCWARGKYSTSSSCCCLAAPSSDKKLTTDLIEFCNRYGRYWQWGVNWRQVHVADYAWFIDTTCNIWLTKYSSLNSSIVLASDIDNVSSFLLHREANEIWWPSSHGIQSVQNVPPPFCLELPRTIIWGIKPHF